MAIHTEKTEHRAPAARKTNGWLALSPLFVFLVVYLAGSLVAHDFYKVPVAAAFIIASAYALLITRNVEKTDDKIACADTKLNTALISPSSEMIAAQENSW